MENKKTIGGYRQGSGRAKTGYYKGIYCGSTYELVWIIYQIDHNLPFKRFDGCIKHPITQKKYYPDFLQDGIIIEIKGFESQESVEKKNEIAKLNGFDVIVKRKDQLIDEFNWVKEKYNLTKDFDKLYDDFKPKHEYVCQHCSNLFDRNRPIKTKGKFCSRYCAGAGHVGWHPGCNEYSKKIDAP